MNYLSIIQTLQPIRAMCKKAIENFIVNNETKSPLDMEIHFFISSDDSEINKTLWLTVRELPYFIGVSDIIIHEEKTSLPSLKINIKRCDHKKCTRCRIRSATCDHSKYFSKADDELFCYKCVQVMCGYEEVPRLYF